ncbi:MAG: carboxymuconolactone decarboxylase family protein [Pyrinomonadaceae bacterium]
MLRRATGDDELAEAILRDYRAALLSEKELAMLDYSVQLTIDATKITPDTHERLRRVGFDDTGILQITLIASWFNYINRVADSLGIGR